MGAGNAVDAHNLRTRPRSWTTVLIRLFATVACFLAVTTSAAHAGAGYWKNGVPAHIPGGPADGKFAAAAAACSDVSRLYVGYSFVVTSIDMKTMSGSCQATMPYGAGTSGPAYYSSPLAYYCDTDVKGAAGCLKDPQPNLDQNCSNSSAYGNPATRPMAGNPVSLANGDKIERALDYSSSGSHPFILERVYSFQNDMPVVGSSFGAFGMNWHGPMDRSLVLDTIFDTARVYVEGGQVYDFQYNGTVYNQATWARQDKLVKSGSDIIWTSWTGEKTTFRQLTTGGRWRVVQIDQIGGHSVAFAYTSGVLTTMTDEFGRSATFTWTGGLISQIALSGGETITYAYQAVTSAAGLPGSILTAVTRTVSSVARTVTYHYEDTLLPNALTGVTDERGVRFATWTWDFATRRVLTSQHAGGAELTTIAYNDVAKTRTVTNALGKQAIYQFSLPGSWLTLSAVSGQASAHCPASSTALTYDTTRKFVASRTDENGRQTTYVRDTLGRETSRTEAAGTSAARTVTTTWNANFPLPDQITEPKLRTNFVYDAKGNPTSITLTDLTTYTAPYATNGRTRTWTYTYTAQGLLQTATGPVAGSTTTYAYDANGDLSQVTNPLSQVTQISEVNARGQPTTIVDANGITSTLAYDLDGNLTSATLNPGSDQSQYQFDYNAVGDLTHMTLPGGGYLQYTYDDARRLTLITNDRGETITLTPNALGDATSSITRTGSTITAQQTYAYDELGRMIQSIGAGSQTTTLGYDKVSNLTSMTDARSKTFATAFDPLDRVITQTDPETHSVQYAYDAADQITSHKDGRALETTMIVDGFGQVIQENSPDRGLRKYWYDTAGQMTKLVDGDAEETNFTYDLAGRRTSMTFPGAAQEAVTYTYDAVAGGNKGVGRLTGVTEESGSTNLKYDGQGRLVTDTKVIDGLSYAVNYAYDANGKVTQITLPSGRVVAFTRASDGLVTAATTKPTSTGAVQNIATNVAYQPLGPLKQLTYGNGLTLTRTHDQNYWLTGAEVSATGANRLDLTFSRNANGQLDGVTDNAATGRSASYGYTDAGRLQYGVGPWGDHGYVYDAAGNRTDLRIDVGGVVSHEFAATSGSNNRVTLVADASSNPLRNLQYRDGGDLYEDARVGGATYQYYYNARKRLVAVNKDTVDQAYYTYDWRNQRVSRQILVPTYAATHYIYDQQGHLLAEHNGSTGAVIKQYIWLDDMPLAVIDNSSGMDVVYYIHTGQMDEPLVMTDTSKAKVWDAYVEPFGRAQVFGTATANIDLRLPGQWAQLEAGGLSQNWNRDYDPTLARYIQADPVGLKSGQNVYAYVDGRPTEFLDPLGLDAIYLNDSAAVNQNGHGSLLVGNESSGWHYFTKDGPMSPNKNQHLYFNDLTDAFRDPALRRFDRFVTIQRSPSQDLKMTIFGLTHYRERYDFVFNNCADLVIRILRAGDVNIGENPYKGRGDMLTVPNKVYDELSKKGNAWGRSLVPKAR
jgi:RHS repeat-associated protein